MSSLHSTKLKQSSYFPTQKSSFLEIVNANIAPRSNPVVENQYTDYWSMIDHFAAGPVFIINDRLQILKVNQQFCDFIAKCPEELTGSRLLQLCRVSESLFQRPAPQASQRSESRSTVALFPGSKKARYGKLTIKCLPPTIDRDSGEYRFIVLVNDVTELVEKNNSLSSELKFLERKEVADDMIGEGIKIVLEEVKDQIGSLILEKSSNPAFKELTLIVKKVEREVKRLESKRVFLQHFEKICPSFSCKLLKYSPSLTASEVKHCAYVYMQLSPYDVAEILGINKRSVEMARYRIKKKLGLGKNQSMRLFLNDIACSKDNPEQL